MTLLQYYFDRIQRRLLAEGEAANAFHHSLNRGQIREAFVREFLVQNISDSWGVGTGEIIDKTSTRSGKRPQIDVVLHNKTYPKLSLSTGIDLFFVETVSCFIEIKSRLKKEHISKIANDTKHIKRRVNHPPQRLSPLGTIKTPRPYSFVFAYDGPQRIETVLKWMRQASEEQPFRLDALRDTEPGSRAFFPHHFIDGIFVLGRGCVLVDGSPFKSLIARAIKKGLDVSEREIWYYSKEHELLMLWAYINQVNACLSWSVADLTSYVGTVPFLVDD